jgi:hypothetical protein
MDSRSITAPSEKNDWQQIYPQWLFGKPATEFSAITIITAPSPSSKRPLFFVKVDQTDSVSHHAGVYIGVTKWQHHAKHAQTAVPLHNSLFQTQASTQLAL